MRLGLLLADVGEAAGVKVSEDEVRQALVERARSFPGQEKAVWDFYRKIRDALAELRAPIYEEKVVDHVLAQIKVTDRTVPKEELLKVETTKTKRPARSRPGARAGNESGARSVANRRQAAYLRVTVV